MVPMPIHTVPTDKEEYIRVVGSFEMLSSLRTLVGRVGRVSSRGQNSKDIDEMIFTCLHGDSDISVFKRRDVIFITEKEYFLGALSG